MQYVPMIYPDLYFLAVDSPRPTGVYSVVQCGGLSFFISSPGTEPQVRGPRQPRHQRLLHPQRLPPALHGREGHLHPSVEGDGRRGGRQQGETGLCLVHLHQLSRTRHQLGRPRDINCDIGGTVYTQPERRVSQWTAVTVIGSAGPLRCHCCVRFIQNM